MSNVALDRLFDIKLKLLQIIDCIMILMAIDFLLNYWVCPKCLYCILIIEISLEALCYFECTESCFGMTTVVETIEKTL